MRDPAESLFNRRRFWNKTNVTNLTSEYFELNSLHAFIIKTIPLHITVVLHRSPPKDLNQENWSCTHFYWFKSPTWSRKSLSGGLESSSSTKHGGNSTARWRLSVFESFNLWSVSELNVLCRRSGRLKQREKSISWFSQVREPLKKGSEPIHRCGEKCSSRKTPCKAISLIRLDSSNWQNFSSQQKTPWYGEELCA